MVEEGEQQENPSEETNGTSEGKVIKDGLDVVVGGMVTEKKVIFTKNNNKMAFVTLEDLRGTMEVVVFPNLYEQFVHFPEDSVFVVRGRISIKEETNIVILAEKMTTLNNLLNPGCDEKHVRLKLDESMRTPEIRNELLQIFQSFKGKTKIIVENREDGSLKPFPAKYNVQICDELVQKLINLLGQDCVTIMN